MALVNNLLAHFPAQINYYGMVIAEARVDASIGFRSLIETLDSTLEDASGTVYIGLQMLKEKDL